MVFINTINLNYGGLFHFSIRETTRLELCTCVQLSGREIRTHIKTLKRPGKYRDYHQGFK